VKILWVIVSAILVLQRPVDAQEVPGDRGDSAPSGTPEPQARPDLLPESGVLPQPHEFQFPPDFILPGILPEFLETLPPPDENQLSPEELERNRRRLHEIKEEAMRSSRSSELLRLSEGALTEEARRGFMRAYYHTICNEMRKLEPGLRQDIKGYEREQIRSLASGRSPLISRSRREKKKTSSMGHRRS
jgi:hypothetical protein